MPDFGHQQFFSEFKRDFHQWKVNKKVALPLTPEPFPFSTSSTPRLLHDMVYAVPKVAWVCQGDSGDGSGKILSKKNCKVTDKMSSQKESNLPTILFLGAIWVWGRVATNYFELLATICTLTSWKVTFCELWKNPGDEFTKQMVDGRNPAITSWLW